MITKQNIKPKKSCWYLLSKNEYSTDKLDNFINNRYWEYYKDNVKRDEERNIYLGYLQKMKIGDRVAAYKINEITREEFEQKYKYKIGGKRKKVRYLTIMAVGKFTQVYKDKKTIKIEWQKINDPRKWYFHLQGGQIWQVVPDNSVPWRQNLIDFTFNGAKQDLAELKDVLTK